MKVQGETKTVTAPPILEGHRLRAVGGADSIFYGVCDCGTDIGEGDIYSLTVKFRTHAIRAT